MTPLGKGITLHTVVHQEAQVLAVQCGGDAWSSVQKCVAFWSQQKRLGLSGASRNNIDLLSKIQHREYVVGRGTLLGGNGLAIINHSSPFPCILTFSLVVEHHVIERLGRRADTCREEKEAVEYIF